MSATGPIRKNTERFCVSAYGSTAAVIVRIGPARSRHPTRRPQRLDEVRADVLLRSGKHPPEVARLDVARRNAPAAVVQQLADRVLVDAGIGGGGRVRPPQRVVR